MLDKWLTHARSALHSYLGPSEMIALICLGDVLVLRAFNVVHKNSRFYQDSRAKKLYFTKCRFDYIGTSQDRRFNIEIDSV